MIDTKTKLEKIHQLSDEFAMLIKAQINKLTAEASDKNQAKLVIKNKTAKINAATSVLAGAEQLANLCEELKISAHVANIKFEKLVVERNIGKLVHEMKQQHLHLISAKDTPRIGWKGLFNVGVSKTAGLIDNYLNALASVALELQPFMKISKDSKQYESKSIDEHKKDDMQTSSSERSPLELALLAKLKDFSATLTSKNEEVKQRTISNKTENANVTKKITILGKANNLLEKYIKEIGYESESNDLHLKQVAEELCKSIQKLVNEARKIEHVGKFSQLASVIKPVYPDSKTTELLVEFNNAIVNLIFQTSFKPTRS